MTIELWDLDVPYEVIDDCTDEGVDIIKIRPNSIASDRDDTYDICLDYNGFKHRYDGTRCLIVAWNKDNFQFGDMKKDGTCSKNTHKGNFSNCTIKKAE